MGPRRSMQVISSSTGDPQVWRTSWRIIGPNSTAPERDRRCRMTDLASALAPDGVLTLDWRPVADQPGGLTFTLTRPSPISANAVGMLMAAVMPDLLFEMTETALDHEPGTEILPCTLRHAGPVRMGAFSAVAGLSRAAAILAPAGLKALRIHFRSHQLTAAEVTQINATLYQAGDGASREAIDTAQAWIANQRGLATWADILTEEPLDSICQRMVREALFGAGVHPEPGMRAGSLDLSHCGPVSGEWPALLPDHRLRSPPRSGQSAPRLDRGDLRLGRNALGGDVTLGLAERALHTYVVGATGAGKSTLLSQLILQDARNGEGIILIDPHGDLAHRVRRLLPPERMDDLVWMDVTDPTSAIGLNILESAGGDPAVEREFVVNELMAFFKNVLYRAIPEAFGPMFEQYFRNTMLLLMLGSPEPSLRDFTRVMSDSVFRSRLLKETTDPAVREFWTDVAPHVSGEASLDNIRPYITCKLTQFTGNALTSRMLDNTAARLDIPGIMRDRRIALITLEKGKIGGFNAAFIGALLAIRIAQTAMARGGLPPGERTPCRLYIDEFQTLAGDSLADTLAEARKYGLTLTLANQNLSQIGGARSGVGAAALANCATLIAFRVGAPDADELAPWFSPEITRDQLTRLANFTAAVRVLGPNGVAPPAVMWCDRPEGPPTRP